MDVDKIGCIVVCKAESMPDKYIGIQCAKGRGKILPGGKWDPLEYDCETFKDCAAREFEEEVGVPMDTRSLTYLWHGPDGFGFHTFAFLYQGWTINLSQCKASGEGEPCLVTEEELYQSKYAAYYRILFEIMRKQYTRSKINDQNQA